MSMESSRKEPFRPVAGIAVIRNPIQEENDVNDDVKDLKRKPSEKLFLIVKKPRDDNAWGFPQGGLKQKKKETLVEGALRELKEECSKKLKVKPIDQDAFCTYQYDYPLEFYEKKKKEREQKGKEVYKGSEVQFIRAEWVSGQCRPDGTELVDFAWLTREEVGQYISDSIMKGIQPILDA